MDVLSHGLWGGLAAGRKSRRDWWVAFTFGVAPDVLSFGILWALTWLGLNGGPDWRQDHWNPALFPAYVSHFYNITHSFVIFGVVFGLVYLARRRPYAPMLAWGLHILMDIPTHSYRFFPTPFLWPLVDLKVNGISWATPEIFFPNIILLMILYAAWWHRARKK